MRYVGLIAQEVMETTNYDCVVNIADDEIPDMKGIDYHNINMRMIAAVQCLSDKIDNLEIENTNLKSRIYALENP